MTALYYGGLLLEPGDVSMVVSGVVGGRIPVPRRGRPPTDDPLTWLEGLLDEAAGTDLEPPIQRALELALRTGAAPQLRFLAALAERRPRFALDDLLGALERPVIQRSRPVAAMFGRAICTAILHGGAPWDPRLRSWSGSRRVLPHLLPAMLVHDPSWTVGWLTEAAASDPERVTDWVREAVDRVPSEHRPPVLHAVATLLDPPRPQTPVEDSASERPPPSGPSAEPAAAPPPHAAAERPGRVVPPPTSRETSTPTGTSAATPPPGEGGSGEPPAVAPTTQADSIGAVAARLSAVLSEDASRTLLRQLTDHLRGGASVEDGPEDG